jgi:hypothetical protein
MKDWLLRGLLVTASYPQPIRKGDEVFSAPSKVYLAHLAADTNGVAYLLHHYCLQLKSTTTAVLMFIGESMKNPSPFLRDRADSSSLPFLPCIPGFRQPQSIVCLAPGNSKCFYVFPKLTNCDNKWPFYLKIRKVLPRHHCGDLGRDWGDWTYTIFVFYAAEVSPFSRGSLVCLAA